MQQPSEHSLLEPAQVQRQCNEHLLLICYLGHDPFTQPLQVDRIPPFIGAPYASEQLFNTSCLKRFSLRQVAKGEHTAPSAADGPSTKHLHAFADLMRTEQLDLLRLRDDHLKDDELAAIMRRCGASKSATATSAAQKRGWLLALFDTLLTGESDCHLFTAVAHGTGLMTLTLT